MYTTRKGGSNRAKSDRNNSMQETLQPPKMNHIQLLPMLVLLATLTLVNINIFPYPQMAYADGAETDPQVLSLREQELKRKEEELLRAMGLATSEPSPIEEQSRQPSSATRIGALDRIRSHPALSETYRKKHSAAIPTNGQIRTHYSTDHYDGTTAKRINRFYKLPRYQSSAGTVARTQRAPISQDSSAHLSPELTTQKSDMLVATVSARRVTLKTGPSRSDIRITTLSRETPLEIDYRKGSWYRVRTETGVRGWLEGKHLLFNEGINPSSTVHIGGISSKTVY
jgi:hypothetical protein